MSQGPWEAVLAPPAPPPRAGCPRRSGRPAAPPRPPVAPGATGCAGRATAATGCRRAAPAGSAARSGSPARAGGAARPGRVADLKNHAARRRRVRRLRGPGHLAPRDAVPVGVRAVEGDGAAGGGEIPGGLRSGGQPSQPAVLLDGRRATASAAGHARTGHGGIAHGLHEPGNLIAAQRRPGVLQTAGGQRDLLGAAGRRAVGVGPVGVGGPRSGHLQGARHGQRRAGRAEKPRRIQLPADGQAGRGDRPGADHASAARGDVAADVCRAAAASPSFPARAVVPAGRARTSVRRAAAGAQHGDHARGANSANKWKGEPRAVSRHGNLSVAQRTGRLPRCGCRLWRASGASGRASWSMRVRRLLNSHSTKRARIRDQASGRRARRAGRTEAAARRRRGRAGRACPAAARGSLEESLAT